MLRRIDFPDADAGFILNGVKKTEHSRIRNYRVRQLNASDKVVAAFLWDRGHKDGPEVHFITESAKDIIINADSKRLITILNCRENQIRRLFDPLQQTVPIAIIKLARRNNDLHLNR